MRDVPLALPDLFRLGIVGALAVEEPATCSTTPFPASGLPSDVL